MQYLGREKHQKLKERIHHLFEENDARYGYRRIWLALRSDQNPEYAQFRSVNKKLVYKLMHQMGLKSKVRRKRRYHSYRGTVSHIAENKLNRQFSPEAPNKVWVSDVTEFRVAGSKVYLSPLMDLFDRSILSYRLSTSPNTAFTAGSLRDAISWHAPVAGLVVHTDQGFQYQHSSWKKLIDSVGGVQSMSRKGNCYDNAVMENFFGHLKSEMYHGETFAGVEEFCRAVDDYIFWYNNVRVQERIKGLAPMCYRGQTLGVLTV